MRHYKEKRLIFVTFKSAVDKLDIARLQNRSYRFKQQKTLCK